MLFEIGIFLSLLIGYGTILTWLRYAASRIYPQRWASAGSWRSSPRLVLTRRSRGRA